LWKRVARSRRSLRLAGVVDDPPLVELFGFVVGSFLNSPEDGDSVAFGNPLAGMIILGG
jgi:hypothetical protein